jgi:hypothetical protein
MNDSASDPDLSNEQDHKWTVFTRQQIARSRAAFRAELRTIRLFRATNFGFSVAKEANSVIRS